MTTITALPTPPSRQDPINFAERADDFLGALPAFVTETNLVASELNTANSEAQAAASDAQDSAALAETAANAATAIANITAWQSGNTYAVGAVVYSLVNFLSYRRKTAGAGTTDPSTDSTNWQIISNTGDVTLTGAQTLTNKIIEAGTFTNGYTEETVTANTSAAYTINLANGTVQILTLTGNCTYTFPAAVAGTSFLLVQKQDATGSRTVTWPTAVKWPASTAPTITSTASKADVFAFTCDGTNWFGRVIGQNYL